MEHLLRRLTVQEDFSEITAVLTDREARAIGDDSRPDREVFARQA
ncbi:MAG: hypothetical protein ACK4QP_09825 [Pseudorhizobium sp.]